MPLLATVTRRSEYPVVGVVAVMVGAFISTLNVRLTTQGLADIRGALGLGFDEGSRVSTIFSAAQMVVTPAAAWMSTVLSTRRVLLWTGAIFAAASLPPPLVHDYDTLIALQFVRGLAVGAFIPAALGFVLRSLAPRWWIWGIAAYAFRFVFSQNIGSAVEGWYSETGHWEWIFWQNAALTPVMMLLTAIAMPRRPVDGDLLRQTDWAGIVYAGVGFGLIYAGLDQGNRLDWLNSGLVSGLLLGGGLLVIAFLLHETRAEYPLISLRVLVQPRRGTGLADLDLRFRGDGDFLRVAGLSDPRPGLARLADRRRLVLDRATAIRAGAAGRAVAEADRCPGAARVRLLDDRDRQLDRHWARLWITALITFGVANITPPQAAAIAATIQIARLLGNEIGSAVIQTFVRVREQVYSNLIGLHVVAGQPATEQTAAQLAGPFGSRATGIGDAAAQGAGVLASFVRREASVLSYIDAFWLIAWVSLLAVLLILLLRPPPPNPLIPSRKGS